MTETTKYTPGPWEAKLCRVVPEAEPFGFEVRGGEKLAALASAGVSQQYSQLPGWKPEEVSEEFRKMIERDFFSIEEIEANARLISAAPELAEVLVRMLAKYRAQNPAECDDHDCLCVSVVKQAEDALQKAGIEL